MTPQAKNGLFSVRGDPHLKADASAILASYGLNLSDAVRMFLTRKNIRRSNWLMAMVFCKVSFTFLTLFNWC
jgi:hypothetical protein